MGGDGGDGKGEYEGVDDGGDMGQLKSHCCGHHFHWAEILFAFFFAVGLTMTLDFYFGFLNIPEEYNEDVQYALAIVFVVSSALSTSLMWNLVSIKRIAACAEMMKKEVEALRYENERSRHMQEEKRRQDQQMKEQLANLEKAQLLLKGSVTGLEDVKKQNEDMMAERLELLEERKELADKLEDDMADLWEATIRQAKEELTDRAESYFSHANKSDEGIEIGSPEWEMLEGLMAANGIELATAKEASGDDGIMDSEEFETWLDQTLNFHFEDLKECVRENEKLTEEITSAKIEIMNLERAKKKKRK